MVIDSTGICCDTVCFNPSSSYIPSKLKLVYTRDTKEPHHEHYRVKLRRGMSTVNPL